MARRTKRPEDAEKKYEADTPLFDDFLYDDMRDADGVSRTLGFDDAAPKRAARPAEDAGDESDSLTPEEALRQLRGEPSPAGAEDASAESPDEAEGGETEDEQPEDGAGLVQRMRSRHGVPKREMKAPVGSDEVSGPPSRLRRIIIGVITFVLTAVVFSMFFFRITGIELLGKPEGAIASVMTPVQGGLSWITDQVLNYLRGIKLRSNLESAYEDLRAENDQLVYRAMMADEYLLRLSQYEDMSDEVRANRNMSPITCRVIGRDSDNYFSVFTIDKGSEDGIRDYMAVTISGALVGYTENVRETSCTVRCIIDSEASIAALIQSSRDQGTVTGTLGIDGSWSCRMYYLSDDRLPRPGDTVVTSGVGMSFPKGIPIGTVRESTRGMEANKQYIVVEPIVDFAHIEYVIVLRYQPDPDEVTGRDNTLANMEFVPLETARPYPTLRMISASLYGTPTPAPEGDLAEPEDTTLPEDEQEAETPAPTETFAPVTTPSSTSVVYEYQPVETGPTATPSPSPSPSPTPYITLTPDDMTWEDD